MPLNRCIWPNGRHLTRRCVNEALNREMALVMKLASLGHAARNKANRKVRQPLAEVAFSVGSADEARVVLAILPICSKMS